MNVNDLEPCMTVFYIGDVVEDDIDIEAVDVTHIATNNVRIHFLDTNRQNIEVSPDDLYGSWLEARVARLEKKIKQLYEQRGLIERELKETQHKLAVLKEDLERGRNE